MDLTRQAQRARLIPASCRSIIVGASFPAQLGGELPSRTFQGRRGPPSLARSITDQPAPQLPRHSEDQARQRFVGQRSRKLVQLGWGQPCR